MIVDEFLGGRKAKEKMKENKKESNFIFKSSRNRLNWLSVALSRRVAVKNATWKLVRLPHYPDNALEMMAVVL